MSNSKEIMDRHRQEYFSTAGAYREPLSTSPASSTARIIYSARSDKPGHIVVKMPGCEYGMYLEYAEKLRDELTAAIGVARGEEWHGPIEPPA